MPRETLKARILHELGILGVVEWVAGPEWAGVGGGAGGHSCALLRVEVVARHRFEPRRAGAEILPLGTVRRFVYHAGSPVVRLCEGR